MRLLLLAGLIALGACTSAAPTLQPNGDGSPTTDLEANYEFEPYPGSRWNGPDGDEISEDTNIINAITGPEHCNWQSAVMMHVGWPPGHDAADSSESRQYVRDPDRVFPRNSVMGTLHVNTELPERAGFTGYRTDFMELWIDPTDDTTAYLVFADHVERWPRARETIACA